MSHALIRRAFETRLKAWADEQTPAIPVAWPNREFVPPVGRYVRASVIPADTLSRHLGRTDRQYRGVFQASLVMPTGTGAGAAESLVASLDAEFPHTFTESTLVVWLLRPFSPAPAIQEDDRYVVPVSAEYEANVT